MPESRQDGAPTIDDLRALDDDVRHALAARDVSGLNVMGFGEISIALGWPTEEPRFVCKRTPPADREQLDEYRGLVERYIEELAAVGVTTAETELHVVDRSDLMVGYLVQPAFPSSQLGHNILAEDEPSADHPLLAAIAETLSVVTPQLSVDAQFSNWAFDGTTLTLLDIGTPFLWDGEGRFLLDISPFMVLFPRPIRGVVAKDIVKIAAQWRTTRGVAVDVVASLYRTQQERWVDPVLDVMNAAIGPGDPITAAEARAFYDDDLKTWPRLKRMQQIQRAWQTRILRQPYEFFIQNSYTGEIS